MKIPYLTDKMTRKICKKLNVKNTGAVAITFLGFILYELPFEAI